MTHAPTAPKLSAMAEGYTFYEERTRSFAARREMPSLRPVLIVNLGDAIEVVGGDGVAVQVQTGSGFVAGLHDRHAVSKSMGGQAGVHVWLSNAGFRRLLGRQAGAVANRVVTLDVVLGPDGAALGGRVLAASGQVARAALLDCALESWLACGTEGRPDMAWAFDRLVHDPSQAVGDLAREIGCSRKTLSRQFTDWVGLSPKTVARLARFQHVVEACGPAGPDWAGLAADAGYFDQPHLIRDFVAFAGMTPSEYRRRLLPAGGGVVER